MFLKAFFIYGKEWKEEKNGNRKTRIETVMSFPVTLESYISNVLSSLKQTPF